MTVLVMAAVATMLGVPVAILAPAMEDVVEDVRQVVVAADVARCESGHNWGDGAVVLQTALNRAKKWGGSLIGQLTAPNQFAFGCPRYPRTWAVKHLHLGILAVADDLPVPPWARRSLFYCGPSDRPGDCQDRRSDPVGEVIHTFYARWADTR